MDTSGYKRVDGFSRFDGRDDPAQFGIWTLITDDGYTLGSGTEIDENVVAGYEMFSSTSDFPFGAVARIDGLVVDTYIFRFVPKVSSDSPYWPKPGEDIYVVDPVTGISIFSNVTADPVYIDLSTLTDEQLADFEFTTEFLSDLLNESYLGSRDNITPFSWGARAHGLQWFGDRLYSVADCEHMYFTLTGAINSQVLYAGETLTLSGGAQVEILDLRVIEGSLATSGSILKILVRRLDNTTIADAETATTSNGRVTGSPLTYSATLPTLSSGIVEPATWGACMYRSTSTPQATSEGLDEGWNPVDMGLEVDFTGGTTTTPPAELTRENYGSPVTASTPRTITADTSAADFATTTNSGFTVVGAAVGSAIAASSDGTYIRLTAAGGGVWGSGGHDGLEITGFDASALPEDAYVTGIELKLHTRTRTSGGGTPAAGHTASVPDMYLTGFAAGSANRGNVSSYTVGVGPASTVLTFGSATDTWGLSNLISRGNLIASTWGFKTRFNPSSSLASGEYLEIDRVEIIVHYVPSTTRIYIRNAGGDEVSADVIRSYVRVGETGTFPALEWSSAAGTLHLYNIANVAGSSTKDYVAPGDIIALTQGGSSIATVSGVKGSMLPTLSETVANEVRYEFIKANFYANENWEAIYGVSGSGRAFVYDGFYFRKIYTAYEESIDRPRHLCYYRNYLALGYPSGSVLLSALGADGPEPEQFHQDSTATSWNFNDKVFALHTLPDTSLGVFCESSIQRLVLDGAGDIVQSSISPNSGVIEYTVAPVGPTVMFCDARGVRDLEQVDVYGDFVGEPLSQKLGGWLRSRLSRFQPYTGSESIKRVVAAYAVRNKNQYRLWFSDGQQLTMTLLGNQQEPVFTFQQFDDGSSYYCPIAISSGVDQFGRERIHFSHYCSLSAATDSVNTDSDKKYVFEMDKGWHFDDNVINASIDLSSNFLDNPVEVGVLHKVRLYGNSSGIAELTVATRNGFNDDFSSTTVDISLPRGTEYGLFTDPRFYKNMAPVSERGDVVGIRIRHAPTDGRPPHTLQSIILDYKQAKNAN